MALERRDPIPPGVYWVDVLSDNAASAFSAWIRQWSDPEMPRARGLKSTQTWRLFEVLAPVPRWDAGAGLGFPTIAPRGRATSKSDTVQKPVVKGPLDTLSDALTSPGAGLLVLALLWAFSKRK